MLEGLGLFDQLTVDFDLVLLDVILVRDQSCDSAITVEIEAALTVSDTNGLDVDGWCEFFVSLSDKVVSFVKSMFDLSTHAGVLIEVSDLGSSLQAGFFLLTDLLLTLLLCKLAFELLLLALHLSKSFLLLLHFPLELFIHGSN